MKKYKANVCVMLGAALLLMGCGKEKTREDRMRIAYFPNITHAQALLMKNRGTLEKELQGECEVEWKTFTAGSAELEALFAEEIDIGYIGPVPAINGNVKSGGDLTVIANAADAGAVLVRRKDSEITSAADLDGKTVAVPQIGNTQHLCLLNLLSENGLAPLSEGGSVEIVAVDNANVQNMMDQGALDAALVPEPWGTILTSNENVELLLDYRDIYLEGNYPVSLVIVRNEFLEEHPDEVEVFLKAHREATDTMNEKLEEAADAVLDEMEEATGNRYEKETVIRAFSKTKLTTVVKEEALEAFAKIACEQEFISALPTENFVNTKAAGRRQEAKEE